MKLYLDTLYQGDPEIITKANTDYYARLTTRDGTHKDHTTDKKEFHETHRGDKSRHG